MPEPKPLEDASSEASRAAATEVAGRLRAAGHVALFAGGCVRDRLLGHEPKDFDVATNATPDAIRDVFPHARSVGEAFGVMLVRSQGWSIEVATFRSDGPYTDARRPDAVTWSDAAGDAARRDFTINGLFEDPETGAIIDHVGGRSDLAAGVVRAIGSAADRLHEDRLRTLRAVRFAARLGFDIEAGTAEAIRAAAAGLAAVSRERIGLEIRAMLSGPARARAVDLIEELGLAGPVFEGFAAAGRSGPHLRGLEPAASAVTGMAAWISDGPAGPIVGRARARRTVAGWRAALVLSNRETRDLESMLVVRAGLAGDGEELAVGAADRKRLFAAAGCFGAMQLEVALDPGRAARLRAEARRLAASTLDPEPIVSGRDLIEAGIPPGPGFDRVLRAVDDAWRTGGLVTRAGAVALARDLAGRTDGPGAAAGGSA